MEQLLLYVLTISQLTASPTAFVRRPKACALAPLDRQIRTRRKPDWLGQEVLRLKAHMPRAGCRAVAHTFNRLHPDASVG